MRAAQRTITAHDLDTNIAQLPANAVRTTMWLLRQELTDGGDDSFPASTVRTRYERMLKERDRRPDADPGTPGGSQVRHLLH